MDGDELRTTDSSLLDEWTAMFSGHDEWYLEITVDLPASADSGEVVAGFVGLRRR